MKTSDSDNYSYNEVCENATKDDNLFKSFKSNNAYREVLEHVSFDQGKIYLEYVLSSDIFKQNKDKFKINDMIGSPNLHDYGNNEIWSPTTLRYIYNLIKIVENFGDLSGKTIIEIGGGYGGQRLLIDTLYNCNYTIIDLAPTNKLQRKYLEANACKGVTNFISANSLIENPIELPGDLVISNFAYDECVSSVRQVYMKTIANKQYYITTSKKCPELSNYDVENKYILNQGGGTSAFTYIRHMEKR